MELGNIIQGMERDCAKERKKLEDELFTHKCMYPLSFEEFCWVLTTNANNILLKRGLRIILKLMHRIKKLSGSYSCILQGIRLANGIFMPELFLQVRSVVERRCC